MIIPPPRIAPVVPIVPFYSQFADIHTPSWQKIGCGITSLAMIINYYKPDAVSVDNLLLQGIASGAYDKNAGWIHKDLIDLSKKYGLHGSAYDLSKLSSDVAFIKLKKALEVGPVIVSVYYKFNPKSTIPHLVVIDGIDGDTLHYNDPASNGGDKTISVADFQKAGRRNIL